MVRQSRTLLLAEEPGEPEAEAGGPIVVTWGDGST
jgi:hypothetical protein